MSSLAKIVGYVFVPALAVCIAIGLYFRFGVTEIDGDRFKDLYINSAAHAYSSWRLYKEDENKYYFEYSRPISPIRYSVSKNELYVRPEVDSKGRAFIYDGTSRLKAGRYHGAIDIIF